MRFRLIAKISVLLALVMFFTPFIMVSCSAFEFEESYTGVELMTKNFDTDDEFMQSEAIDFEEFKPNYWLIGAFGLGVVTLVVLFIKRASVIAGITSLLSIVMLIIFRATVVSFYELDKKLEEFERFVDIKARFGYVLCFILLLVTSVMAFCEFKKDKVEVFLDKIKKKVGRIKTIVNMEETDKTEKTELNENSHIDECNT